MSRNSIDHTAGTSFTITQVIVFNHFYFLLKQC